MERQLQENDRKQKNEHISFAKWNDFFAGAAAATPMHLTRQLTAEEDALTKDLAYFLDDFRGMRGMRYVFIRPTDQDLIDMQPFDDVYQFNCPQLPAAQAQPAAPAAVAAPQSVAQAV